MPLRQWVLSVPFELRLLLAQRPSALGAVGRTFVQEILRWQRAQAQARAQVGASSRRVVRGGAICFPQRFGGSLNLNVHYHLVVPDGLFVREPQTQGAATLSFLQLPLTDRGDLDVIALSVEQRVLRWLKRRGLLRASPSPTGEPSERGGDHAGQDSDSVLADCLRSSLGVGELASLPQHRAGNAGSEPAEPAETTRGPREGGRHASKRGFDIHAAVSVSAADREGRERLLRYCARAPLSLERLSELPGGRIAYAIKNPRGKQTHRIMTPTQFLARLCALIPPPRHPLVRFFGVFAPHSSWRRSIVALRTALRSPHTSEPDRADPARVPATSERFTVVGPAKPARLTPSSGIRAPRRPTRAMPEPSRAASTGPPSSSASTTSTLSPARAVAIYASSH